MKHIITLTLTLAISSYLFGQQEKTEFEYKDGDTTYTMKKYYLLIFLSGDNKDSISQSQRAEYMEGHLGNISKMAQEGYVDIAGPLDGTSDKRGILVFNTESIEQIDLLMKNDPLVANERLKYEVHPWWAAKGSCLK